MNEAEWTALLDLVAERDDELGRLTRKLIGEYLTLRAQQGDVDADGQIVDKAHALYERLRRSIGEYSDDIDPMSQMRLTLDFLQGRA